MKRGKKSFYREKFILHTLDKKNGNAFIIKRD